jgi:NAD(P)-dependent dehydrogenase (short-subunit alcohol dehydrogenase family)
MASQPRTIVVFGSGPGIGRSVATQFASQDFDHLILLSRNARRLEEDKQAVSAAASNNKNVRIDTATIDLSSQESIENALHHIDSMTRNVEVVFFNGARVAPTPLFETPVEEIENDFRVSTSPIRSWARVAKRTGRRPPILGYIW